MPPDEHTTVLNTPAEAAAWRRRRPSDPARVTVLTGTFEILQPGNLQALRQAAGPGTDLVVVVEDDGTAPSQAARGGTLYPLADRLAALTFFRQPAAVAAGRSADAPALFTALAPYTWAGCPLPGDGPVTETAIRLAAHKNAIPFLPGCRTADIQAAAREGRTPVPLPPPFAAEPDPPTDGARPAATVNGCFDVLHIGHFQFLDQAARLAGPVTLLINSDASIRRYKGAGRPVFPFAFRRAALLTLKAVAAVHAFDEDEPLALLARLKPPLHIKGGSREPDRVRHEEDLLGQWGGRVAFCPLVDGYSTSAYLGKTRSLNPP
jgi:rfaE bifunctional protein nucleotidyltransferase chain/domain